MYRDDTFAFSKFLRKNGLKLYISIHAARLITGIEPIEYSCEFLLSDFKLEQHTKDYNIYLLFFEQIDILKLKQNVNYSTNKQTLTNQVSPYKIILDINNIIQNPFDSNFVETTRRIDFITSQNSSAL
jgi:hypothetical protein